MWELGEIFRSFLEVSEFSKNISKHSRILQNLAEKRDREPTLGIVSLQPNNSVSGLVPNPIPIALHILCVVCELTEPEDP